MIWLHSLQFGLILACLMAKTGHKRNFAESLTMSDKERKHKRRSDLNERTLEGETLILDRVNGQIHHLNSTASYVWNQCDGASTQRIAEQLAQAFHISSARAEKDVNALLSELKKKNLLETYDDSQLD
jgi:coenzyme PQQ synthesis protein D (PqqD)